MSSYHFQMLLIFWVTYFNVGSVKIVFVQNGIRKTLFNLHEEKIEIVYYNKLYGFYNEQSLEDRTAPHPAPPRPAPHTTPHRTAPYLC